MPGFFSILIDKSILQGLRPEEAEWLFHHFRVNIPPVFFQELLGDLKKERGFSTGTAVGDAQMLSNKIDSFHTDLNMEASDIVRGEVRGRRVPLDGRPIIEAERVADPRGGYGMFVDATPMQRVLERWCAGDFNGMEQAFAAVWRRHLSGINLEGVLRQTKRWRMKHVRSLDALAALVDTYVNPPNQNYANLTAWMTIVGIEPELTRGVQNHWKRISRPPAAEYAPYCRYLARLEMFFWLGVAHQLITTRPSNLIDVEYLKYLPFTKVFASADKLHRDLFPYFATRGQVFIYGPDLKAALAEMAAHYAAMTPEERSSGTMTYANFPPVGMENCITRVYDAQIPDWRVRAVRPSTPISKEANDRMMRDLKPWMDALDEHQRRKVRRR